MPTISILVLRILFVVGIYVFVAWSISWIAKDMRTKTQAVSHYKPVSFPRRAPQPRELVIRFSQGAKRVITLEDGLRVTFGRADSSTVVLHDDYVSTHHCRIEQSNGDWVIFDEASTNGTLLNEQRLHGPTPLRTKDIISIGRTTVEVRL